jgi:hypothetical protein
MHLLEYAPERLAVMELRDGLWSGWGQPQADCADAEENRKAIGLC